MGSHERRTWQTPGAAKWLVGLGNASFGARAFFPRHELVLLWLTRQAARQVEARRLFLWLPVAISCGILLYFAADTEPSLPWAAGATLIAIVLCVAARNRGPSGRAAAVAVAGLLAGFLGAAVRTSIVAEPVLDRVRVARVTGILESVDLRGQGARLVVRPLTVDGLAAAETPYRIRVSTATRPSVQAGDVIEFAARILPPPEPSRPGGYDFPREAFFSGIGAVGSVSGGIRHAPSAMPIPWSLRAAAAVDRMRNAVTLRIQTVIGGSAGAVAASLVTGKRGLIDEKTNQDLRGAGIYHVVSISGLHMVLAAGMVFWILRAALALVPGFSQHYPIKKWAALAAMVAGVAYNVFAGSEIATQRSLIMTLVLLGAILIDRPALSMRNLAMAAILVLLLEPESLLGPSFQMSFAAVAALIAVYERPGTAGIEPEAAHFALLGKPGVSEARPPPTGWIDCGLRAGWLALWGAVLTTLVAETATAPFSLFHFQQFTPYGVIGNALTLPLVSIVVMPAALLGVVAIPFGLDAPVWWIMGVGVQWMLNLSAMVAGWSGSVRTLPAFGTGALMVLCLAMLWATLWTGWLRALAIPVACLGVALVLLAVRPDMTVARDGRSLAVRGPDGRLAIMGRQAGSFAIEQWLRADGDLRGAAHADLYKGPRCDASGCVSRLMDGRAVSHVLSPAAFEEDCVRAAVIVTPLVAPSWCKPTLLIDRPLLDRTGAVSVALATGSPVIVGARERSGQRPWIAVAKPRQTPAAPFEIARSGSRNGITVPPARDDGDEDAGEAGDSATRP